MTDFAAQLGTIAIIGGGKMGEAIVAGLIDKTDVAAADISVANPGAKRRAALNAHYAVTCYADGAEIYNPRTVILAVKPQILRDVAAHLVSQPDFSPQRIISIAAGISTATLQGLFPQISVVRVMPNLALMVGAGMTAVAHSPVTPDSEAELARELFACMGEALLVVEELIDVVTALSGSGPAFIALFARELADAGAKLGLSQAQALTLSVQTLMGTARYLQTTEITPTQLMEMVASPGGTTLAGLQSFAKNDLAGVVDGAVQAAVRRAKELS